MFDGAERAIRCGVELVDALAAIRLSIRVGIHSGEVALSGDRVRGLAVHAAARILAGAGSGEVLVSGTTRDLAEGAAGLAFESRAIPSQGFGSRARVVRCGSVCQVGLAAGAYATSSSEATALVWPAFANVP